MKLHVCCGKRYLEGWVNIDVVSPAGGKRAPDMLADARAIPLADGCASEIMCIHGFEHFYRWEVDALAAEWKRLLKPGGRLVLELPDLLKCCQNILRGADASAKNENQFGLWGLYGDDTLRDPFMCHRWGWSPKSLAKFLKSHGFTNITEAATQWHPAGREHRDMRIEARKAP